MTASTAVTMPTTTAGANDSAAGTAMVAEGAVTVFEDRRPG